MILWNRAARDSANGAISFALVHFGGNLALSVDDKENYRHEPYLQVASTPVRSSPITP